MAVDCPDNFIARNKTPPRYPPPRPPQVNVKQNNNNNNHNHNKRNKSLKAQKRNTSTTHKQKLSPQRHDYYTPSTNQNINIHKLTTFTTTTVKSSRSSLMLTSNHLPPLTHSYNSLKHISTTTTTTTSTNTNIITNKNKTVSLSLTHSQSSVCKPFVITTALDCNHGEEQQNSLVVKEKFPYYPCCNNNTLPKCTAKLIKNNTKFIIHYNDAHHQHQHHLHHQQQPQLLQHGSTKSLFTTYCETTTATDPLQMQNLYNARHQLKLEQLENLENNSTVEYQHHNHHQQSQKLNNALTLKQPLKQPVVAHNPNPHSQTPSGCISPLTSSGSEELELMVDSLYRKGSSNNSSSYESEVLSKNSCESYDTIAYRQLNNNNNNNHLNNKTVMQHHQQQQQPNNPVNSFSSASNSTSSTSSVKSPSLTNQNNVLITTDNGQVLSSISGDSLASLTSTGSTPPPEYELKEFSSKNPILPPLIKHRELPVDVPDSFIEIVKTPPRYPPPTHLASLSSQISSCSSASTANTTLTRINSCNNSNTESHNMSFSPASLQNQLLQQQQQQETSLISTMSLNGSFEDFQQQQQHQQLQQQHHHQSGYQKPQPQVASTMQEKRLEEVCLFHSHSLSLSISLS